MNPYSHLASLFLKMVLKCRDITAFLLGRECETCLSNGSLQIKFEAEQAMLLLYFSLTQLYLMVKK